MPCFKNKPRVTLDTSHELVVQRYHNGIKLLKLEKNSASPKLMLSDLLNLPFPVYVNNTDSVAQSMNESAAEVCGFDSVRESIGKSMFDIAPKEIANRVTKVHREALTLEMMRMTEEDILRKDNLNLQCLTSVMPWYNDENKIAGIFGWSIVLGKHSLADSLTKISQLGLLSGNNFIDSTNYGVANNIENIFLSKREHECLRLYVQGKTAKEIAKILSLSYRTVEHYIDNIKNKVGLSSKYELIKYFIDRFK